MRATTVTVLTVLLLAALAPATALAGGGGYCVSAEPREGSGDTVSMRFNCFEPNILRTEVGATVTFTNPDVLPHRVVGLGMGFGGLEILQQGDEVTATFDEPGIYPYVCDLHPGMLGAVVVGDGLALRDAELAAAPGGSEAAADETGTGLAGTLPGGLVVLVLVGAAFVLGRRRTRVPSP